MLDALRTALNPAGRAADDLMGIMKEGATLQQRFDFMEGFERKKTAALLFFGAIFGLLGFIFAFVIGTLTFLHPFLSSYHQDFPSGYGYFPATVSEMVHDPSQPAGKCFFAFEFIGAYFIFNSWYPWHLRNVYIGDDASLPGIPISWMMFRQFIPPAGMMLVATVTTTPFAQATILDYFCISIHLFGAVMLFAGYGVVEALSLGWGPFSQPPVAERTILGRERTVRLVMLNGVIFWYLLFCILQGVLLMPLEKFGGHNDVWKMTTITDPFGHTIQAVELEDTASGLILALKITSYASEVFCGLFLIASFLTIWFFCHERHADLNEELGSVVSKAA